VLVTDTIPALGICLEDYEYPYPVQFLPLSNDLRSVAMAYNFVELSTDAARDIPRATRVVVPDCGHIPHLEAPGQFLPFLASQSG
jgi:pimeloyl-ACP methyl ester carboxylesterase